LVVIAAIVLILNVLPYTEESQRTMKRMVPAPKIPTNTVYTENVGEITNIDVDLRYSSRDLFGNEQFIVSTEITTNKSMFIIPYSTVVSHGDYVIKICKLDSTYSLFIGNQEYTDPSWRWLCDPKHISLKQRRSEIMEQYKHSNNAT